MAYFMLVRFLSKSSIYGREAIIHTYAGALAHTTTQKRVDNRSDTFRVTLTIFLILATLLVILMSLPVNRGKNKFYPLQLS